MERVAGDHNRGDEIFLDAAEPKRVRVTGWKVGYPLTKPPPGHHYSMRVSVHDNRRASMHGSLSATGGVVYASCDPESLIATISCSAGPHRPRMQNLNGFCVSEITS